MSFVGDLVIGETMYVIPRGAKNGREVIQIKPIIPITPMTCSIRLEIFYPHDKYQVITDKTLKKRDCSLDKYIQDTESWRKK